MASDRLPAATPPTMTMPGASLPAPAIPSSMPTGSQVGGFLLAQDDTHLASVLARHDCPVSPAGSNSWLTNLTPHLLCPLSLRYDTRQKLGETFMALTAQ